MDDSSVRGRHPPRARVRAKVKVTVLLAKKASWVELGGWYIRGLGEYHCTHHSMLSSVAGGDSSEGCNSARPSGLVRVMVSVIVRARVRASTGLGVMKGAASQWNGVPWRLPWSDAVNHTMHIGMSESSIILGWV